MTYFRPTNATLIVALTFASPITSATAQPSASPDEALRIGIEAYIYGYPLVTMELTRRVMTNVVAPNGKFAPVGQFAHLRAYPSPSDKEVTAPNADTLYSLAWLDLSKEPSVLSLPDEDGRYFLMPMLSGWTDVFQVPGKRTTGTKAQAYAITGPDWKGSLPGGMTELKSPTNMTWIVGRTYCTGTPEDYRKVHAIQDKIALVPLGSYGKPYRPPSGNVDPSVDEKTPIRDQVNRMDAGSYFRLLAALLKDNPPAPDDAPIVAKMAGLGIVAGKPFEIDRLDPSVADALKKAPAVGWEAIMGHAEKAGTRVNGWNFSTRTGLYGTDYLQRAFVTAIGLGANRPQDAIYPYNEVSADNKPLVGSNRYVLRFPKGQTPPVDGFWSVTMYDPTYFFVPNSLDRFSISARNNLATNDDGSVDLIIQHASPGEDKESNWLPAPEGNFILMRRMYWPRASVVDGTWQPPAVRKVE